MFLTVLRNCAAAFSPVWLETVGFPVSPTSEHIKNSKLPSLEEINVFNRWNSDNKTTFNSIGWEDEVVRIVLTKDVDVETEWNNFIEANKGLWQPLLDEMDASLN